MRVGKGCQPRAFDVALGQHLQAGDQTQTGAQDRMDTSFSQRRVDVQIIKWIGIGVAAIPIHLMICTSTQIGRAHV